MSDDYDILLETFEAGKTLFDKKKFSEARRNFVQVSNLLGHILRRHEYVQECTVNYDSVPSPIEVYVFLADCVSREADQVRRRGLNYPITKIASDDDSEDDVDDDGDDNDGEESATSRKRRKLAPPPPRIFESTESIDADVVRYKELLQEALSAVESGLSAQSRSSTSPSSSIRCLLIIGAEILLKLSSLGPAISPAHEVASLRRQALSMIDRLDDLTDSSQSPLPSAFSLSYGESFERRRWKALYQLNHEKYLKLVEAHPALRLIRDRKKTLFLAAVSLHSEDASSSPASSKLRYAFPSLDEALLFILPDVFEEALDPENLDRTTTLILLPSGKMEEDKEFGGKNGMEERRVSTEPEGALEEGEGTNEIDGETERETVPSLIMCKKGMEGKWANTGDSSYEDDENLEAEGEELVLEEDDAELCSKYKLTESRDDDIDEDHNLHFDEHICFYNQRFYRLRRLLERGYIVQLLFCDLCIGEENLDACFFLHGLVPKPLDDTTDLMIGNGSCKGEGEEKQLESEAHLRATLEVSDFYDDFGFSQLNLNNDKLVYASLFPAIKSLF